MSVYGIPPLTPEEKERKENEMFYYLESLIKAELVNPDPDYDSVTEIKLLKKIAVADIHWSKRSKLIHLLNNKEDDGD